MGHRKKNERKNEATASGDTSSPNKKRKTAAALAKAVDTFNEQVVEILKNFAAQKVKPGPFANKLIAIKKSVDKMTASCEGLEDEASTLALAAGSRLVDIGDQISLILTAVSGAKGIFGATVNLRATWISSRRSTSPRR